MVRLEDAYYFSHDSNARKFQFLYGTIGSFPHLYH